MPRTHWIVIASGGGSGSSRPALIALVTDVAAGDPSVVSTETGDLAISVKITFKAPADLGTGDRRFSAYEIYCEAPDGALSLAVLPFTGAAGESVSATVVAPYPAGPMTYYFSVVSRSETIVNALALHASESPTPFVAVPVAPLTGAPNVRQFNAGQMIADPENPVQAAFNHVMYWDDRRLRMLADWGCLSPSIWENFSGVQIWIHTADGGYVQATGTYTRDDFKKDPVSGAIYLTGTIAIELQFVPAAPETWELIAVSIDKDGVPNRTAGHETGPAVSLQTLSKADYVSDFDVVIIPGLTESGDQTWRLHGTWTNQEPRRYKGVRIIMRGWAATDEPLADEFDGATEFTSDARPIPDAAKNVSIYAVPIYGDGTVGEIEAGTPHVDLTIARSTGSAGIEYAALVTSFAAAVANPAYVINGQGQKVLRVNISWNNPSSVTFGGIVLWVIWYDGPHIQLTGLERGGSLVWETANFPSSSQQVTFYALSQDTNNRRNSYVPGTTPAVTVTLPGPAAATAGLEYTSNVSFFSVSVANPTTADGTSPTVLTVTFTPPGDVTWGDFELNEFDSFAQTYTPRGIVKTSGQKVNIPTPASQGSVYYYAVSRDVNAKRNSIVPGTTPVQGPFAIGSAAGQFDATKFKPTTYDQNIFTVQNGKFVVWAMAGSLIVDGTVASRALNTQGIAVGGGGQKPGKLEVFNASAQLVGFMGVTTIPGLGTYEGFWAKQGGLGGTIDNRPLNADVSGNLTMTNAVILLTGVNGAAVRLDPNASYSLLRVYDGTSEAAIEPGGVTVQAAGQNNSYPFARLARTANSASLSAFSSPQIFGSPRVLCSVDALAGSASLLFGIPNPAMHIKSEIFSGSGYLDIVGIELRADGTPGATQDVTIAGVTLHYKKGLFTGAS